MQALAPDPITRIECAVGDDFSGLIGGVMQFLAARERVPEGRVSLRICKSDRARTFKALADAAGIPGEVVELSGDNEAGGGPGGDWLWDGLEERDCVKRLKESLHRPARVYEMLRELATMCPAEAMRISELHERALQVLKLESLLDFPRKLHRRRRNSNAAAPEPGVRMIVPCATSGLANRMLLIAGSMRIAELTERRVVVHWPANNQAGCEFEHLFANRLAILQGEELLSLLRTDRTVKAYNAWKTAAPLYTDVCDDGDPEADILLMKGWIYPKFPYEHYEPEFYAANREYLLRFQPQPRIAERVREFEMPSECFGVHIRRGDKLEEFWRSGDEHFGAIMKGLLAARPGAAFFLATDDAGTEAKFRTEFPGRIVSLPKSGAAKTTKEGMEEALTDLLLLSRTRGIVGNFFSTFSHAAAYRSNVPLVIAEARTANEELQETIRKLVR